VIGGIEYDWRIGLFKSQRYFEISIGNISQCGLYIAGFLKIGDPKKNIPKQITIGFINRSTMKQVMLDDLGQPPF